MDIEPSAAVIERPKTGIGHAGTIAVTIALKGLSQALDRAAQECQ